MGIGTQSDHYIHALYIQSVNRNSIGITYIGGQI